MTPILTASYAAIVALIYIAMSAYVISVRAKTHVFIGDGGNPLMLLAIRRHGNMSEYAPFALLIMGLAEMLGLGSTWLHATGTLLIAGRLLHPFGMHTDEGGIAPRVAGTLATFGAIAIPALAILYLSLI